MTNNNILTPNSEYWKDNAIETFKGNSDLFVDFLQERDRHSAWIETQITDVQFEAMFAEPMYIADDAKKYSIPAEIVQEAANNSKLYGSRQAYSCRTCRYGKPDWVFQAYP